MTSLLRTLFFLGLILPMSLMGQPCDLWKAIRACEPAQVQACLTAGADLGARDAKGRTPLLAAIAGEGVTVVHERQKKIVLALLAAGADANAADDRGYTALHYAAYQGTFDLLGLLLRQGADPQAQNEVDETPLHLAARGLLMDDDRRHTFDTLLAAKVAVAGQDTGGRTALHLLCAHRTRLESPDVADETILAMAQRLVEAGAPFKVEDAQGWSPFASAMREGHAQTALWLLQRGAACTSRVLAPFSALHIAVERRQMPLVDALLKAGLDINSTTAAKRQAEGLAYFYPKGSTVLDIALIAEHECKDAAGQKSWREMANELQRRGGYSKTFEEYVKGFKTLKGASGPAGSKTGVKR